MEDDSPVEHVQYPGGAGMLAWAFRRVSGAAVRAFDVSPAIVEDVA